MMIVDLINYGYRRQYLQATTVIHYSILLQLKYSTPKCWYGCGLLLCWELNVIN